MLDSTLSQAFSLGDSGIPITNRLGDSVLKEVGLDIGRVLLGHAHLIFEGCHAVGANQPKHTQRERHAKRAIKRVLKGKA